MIRPATIAFGMFAAEAMNCDQSVLKSSGIREIILIVNTIDIPFPTPFSVIRSPIHISTAEPAVSEVTTIITVNGVLSVR